MIPGRDTFRDLRSNFEIAVSHRITTKADRPPLCERCGGANFMGNNPVCPGPYSQGEQRRIVELLGVQSCLELCCGASAHKAYCVWFRE